MEASIDGDNANFDDDYFDSEQIASPKSSAHENQTEQATDYETVGLPVYTVRAKSQNSNPPEQSENVEEIVIESVADDWQNITIDYTSQSQVEISNDVPEPSTSHDIEICPASIEIPVHVQNEESTILPVRTRGRPKVNLAPKRKRSLKVPTEKSGSDSDIPLTTKKRRIISSDTEDDVKPPPPLVRKSKTNHQKPPKTPKLKASSESTKKRGRPPKTKPKSPSAPKQETRGRKSNLELHGEVKKKIFTQAPIEKSIETLVPYDNITNSILISKTAPKQGRKVKNAADESADEKKTIKKKLQSMKSFKCGSCKFNVSKHLWRDHILEHGGVCWIDELEVGIDFCNWNESLRRLIYTFKLYKIDTITCPNCKQEKKSAMGHLSHYLLCGESEDVIEQRKQACDLCEEKVLPFQMASHRAKCPALHKPQTPPPPEEPEPEQYLTVNSFSATGRLKRQAVQKAETSFKKMATKSSDYSEYIVRAGKLFGCTICVAKFQHKNEAASHVREEHNPNDEGDFDNSDSEAEIKDADEESSDSDESSGVESSEIETDRDFGESDVNELDEGEDGKRKRKKADTSKNDTPEVRYGTKIIGEFYRIKTTDATRKFFEAFWSKEILNKLTSSHIVQKDDLTKLLTSMKFQPHSKPFSIRKNKSYSSKFFAESSNQLTQLQIGQSHHENETVTMFCGGAISSIDWAPMMHDSDFDFLAVACNHSADEVKCNLETTSISLIQIYQFKGLKEKTARDCQLSYIFTVNDGPIWSIKFHPNQSSLKSRIGLLAVTTANQNILIFTLPYLPNAAARSLRIEPSLTCKLQLDDVLFTDQYLYQAMKVNWLVNGTGETFLCAGYISGLLAVWQIDDNDKISLPHHTVQAHQECITSLDIRPSGDDSFQILTASYDRTVKTFELHDSAIRETSSYISLSAVSAAEWCINWPGYVVGHDDCYGLSKIVYKQPLDFGCRNQMLLQQQFTIKSFSINHWNNTVLFATASGEVMSFRQVRLRPSSRESIWSQCCFDIDTYTDLQTGESGEEIGLVFVDLKVSVKI